MLVKLNDDIHVDPYEVAAVEFQFIDRTPPKKKSVIITPDAAKWEPRVVLIFRNGHTLNFKLTETVTEASVLAALDVKRVP